MAAWAASRTTASDCSTRKRCRKASATRYCTAKLTRTMLLSLVCIVDSTILSSGVFSSWRPRKPKSSLRSSLTLTTSRSTRGGGSVRWKPSWTIVWSCLPSSRSTAACPGFRVNAPNDAHTPNTPNTTSSSSELVSVRRTERFTRSSALSFSASPATRYPSLFFCRS